MLWTLLAVVLVLAALAVVGVLGLGLWRQVKGLVAVVTTAGDTLTAAADALDAAQAGHPGGTPARAAES